MTKVANVAGEVELSVMEGPSAKDDSFVWPPRKDILLVPQKDIIVQTVEPLPGQGQQKGKFTLKPTALRIVRQLFKEL